MSALDVRQSLQAAGFDFSRYTSNPLSSIHTTLKRIKDSKQAEDKVLDDTTFYKWIEPKKPEPIEPLKARRYGA
jgi:hypothetical protein